MPSRVKQMSITVMVLHKPNIDFHFRIYFTVSGVGLVFCVETLLPIVGHASLLGSSWGVVLNTVFVQLVRDVRGKSMSTQDTMTCPPAMCRYCFSRTSNHDNISFQRVYY